MNIEICLLLSLFDRLIITFKIDYLIDWHSLGCESDIGSKWFESSFKLKCLKLHNVHHGHPRHRVQKTTDEGK